jgi:hypothetical protein
MVAIVLGILGLSDVSAYNTGLRDQLPTIEYDALVALYRSTGGPAWTDDTGWMEVNASAWFGVEVTDVKEDYDAGLGKWVVVEKGYVRGISLSNNGLEGSLPNEIGNFPGLRTINMSWNALTGSIPTTVSSLNDLLTLRLHNNQLDGTIPESLGTLTKLGILSLSQNDLVGEIPASLGALVDLVYLFLDGNQLTGEIPSSLGQLQRLWMLGLGSNRLTGSIPPELGDMPNLISLNLSFNFLTGEIPLSLGNLRPTLSITLRMNCLNLGNVEAITAALPAGVDFFYSNQSHCIVDPPDLRSTFFEVVEESLDWVNPITVRFKLENLGPGFSEAFRVSFYLSADPNRIDSKSELLKTVVIPGLAPMESTSILTEMIELPQTVPLAGPTGAPNQFYVGIVVDPFEQTPEADEANNYRPILGVGYDSIKIFGPAIISSEEFDAHHLDHPGEGFDPGDEMRVDYHLVNVGYGDAEPFHLEFLWDPPLGSKLSDGHLGRVHIAEGLEAGSETFGFFIATLPLDGSDAYEPTGNGTYLVKPALDPFRLESFAFHNPFCTGNEIYGDEVLMLGLCADLKAGEFTVNDFYPDYRPGDNVPLVFSFQNDSPVEVTDDFTVAIVLSKDAVIDPDTDLILKQIPVDGADRHTTRRFLFESVDLPPQGDPFWLQVKQTYYLGLVVDLYDEVDDCSRDDNITAVGSVGAITVDPIAHSVGGGVSSGNGSSTAPYTAPRNQPATRIVAAPGARFHFAPEDALPMRLMEFQFERSSGSGTLYFTLDGSPPGPTNYAYRLVFSAEDPGPFVVPLVSGSGQLRVYADLPGGITGGAFQVVQQLPPPPAVSVLTPEDLSTGSGQFGGNVAAHGNTVVVSDQSDIQATAISSYGAVYIFRWNGRTWEETKLTPPPGGSVKQFGYSLAVGEDLVMVGYQSFRDKVFLYQWNGSDWVETIIAPSGEDARYWGVGESLEISEKLLAVAAPTYNEGGGVGNGGVFLFHQEESEWVESIVTASDGHQEDGFGSALSISGDTMAVGAGSLSGWPGAVYLYRWDGEVWEETILKAQGLWNQGNRFGGSVSLDGNRLAVGATGRSHLDSGSVYLYDWDGTDWVETILKPSDSVVGDSFGTSVTLVGDLLTVSSKTTVYQFVWNGESWTEKTWIEGPPEGATAYYLTQALSPDAGLLVIGESIFPGPSICTVFNLKAEAGPLPADLLLERYFPAEESKRLINPNYS